MLTEPSRGGVRALVNSQHQQHSQHQSPTKSTPIRFCSFQDNLGANEYRKDRRINGLQLPLHPLQIVGWIALVIFVLATYFVIIPAFQPIIQLPLYATISVLLFIHIIAHVAALIIDPADTDLLKSTSRKVVPEFDRKKHSHVIENGRCHLCNIKTSSSRTKHCSVCNKCVEKFDHHCKYLNQCVGARNYVPFLMCVVTAVVAVLVILAASIAQIVLFYVNPSWLHLWEQPIPSAAVSMITEDVEIDLKNSTLDEITTIYQIINDTILNDTLVLSTTTSSTTTTSEIVENTENGGIGLKNTIYLAIVAVIGILAAITAGLLLHLCFFHIYISYLGLTTYEYIRNHRQSVVNSSQSASANGPSTTTTQSNENKLAKELYVCSDLGTDLRHRPKTLHCCDTSRECHPVGINSSSTSTTAVSSSTNISHKAFYICSVLEERSNANNSGMINKSTTTETATRTFHCCSEFLHATQSHHHAAIEAESIVHYTEQCTFCSFKIKAPSKTDDMAMQDKRCCMKSITKHHRWKRKWNCCSNVPDSPDVPGDPLRTISNSVHLGPALINTIHENQDQQCAQYVQIEVPIENGANNNSNNYGYTNGGANNLNPTTDDVILNVTNTPTLATFLKQNQIRPLPGSSNDTRHYSGDLPMSPRLYSQSDLSNFPPIPVLPPPTRRKIKSPTDLQDLADTLSFIQPSTVRIPVHTLRRNRRKNVLRNRSPTLSPIHESGLSNPTSPQLCRHSCSGSISSLGNSSISTQRPKLSGYEFYEKVLGSAKFVVAPMVDASELAWRLLSRRHGAQLCYTPMFHSTCFAKDPKYRKEALQSCPEDRPLLLQLCGNDPKIILEAALLAQDHCDGIDINLGCPQMIAKRGHYGAFLQDEWELLSDIIRTLHENLLVPVTCKIRVFEDVNKTIKYAQMLQQSGAQLLTVHGRTRDQKGALTGLADWSYIQKVRESVSVPVFANGNIMCQRDVERCLLETGVNGIMSAEGNLQNPYLFDGVSPVTWDVAKEYLDILEHYPAPRSYIRGHLFKIFHHLLGLKDNSDKREVMATSHTLVEFRGVVDYLKTKYLPYHEGREIWNESEIETIDCNLSLPPWICQPYVRIPPEEYKQRMEEKQKQAEENEKQQFFDKDGNKISRKHMKKLKRLSRRPRTNETADRHNEVCVREKCGNTKGLKCDQNLCKACCRNKCYSEDLDCVGHRLLIKTKREKAKQLESLDKLNEIIAVES
ncbi:unnamed protein product [Diamesa serratosioi]